MKMQRSLQELIISATAATPGDGQNGIRLNNAWKAQRELREVAKAATIVEDCVDVLGDTKEALAKLETAVDSLKASERDLLDARRWRAFINSDRIKFFGHAGFSKVDPNGHPQTNYRHFGAEFWTHHSHVLTDEDRQYYVNLLTGYADAAIEHLIATEKSHVL